MIGVPLVAAAAAPVGQNIIVIVDATPGPPRWIEWAIGAALLTAAAVMARRRWAMRDGEAPKRLFRVSAAALTWGSVVTLMLAPEQWHAARGAALALMLLIRLVGLALFAFALVGAADLLLDYFRPHPSKSWLMIAPPLFAGWMLGFVLASGVGASFEVFSQAEYPALIPAGAAAGLSWWSWLPAQHSRLIHVFE